MQHAIDQAIEKLGSQTALAHELGVRPQAVQKWKAQRRVPAERVLDVERVSGVPRGALRPDLYPDERPKRKRAS